MHFSFISSLIGVPFDRMNNSLTIFRCAATDRYNVTCHNVDVYMHGTDMLLANNYIKCHVVCRCSDCLDTDDVCGWCVVNKECSGTAQDCTSTSNFLIVRLCGHVTIM